jgi:hypothetical protein
MPLMHNLVKISKKLARIGTSLTPIIDKQKIYLLDFLARSTSIGMPLSISNIRLVLNKQ